MIKNIFFDAFGTLFRLRGRVGEHYAAVARKLGVEISSQVFDDAFQWAWKNAPLRPAIDHPREDDDKPWWRDLLAAVFTQIANVPSHFGQEQFFEAAYAHFAESGVWTVYPEVPDVLETIAPKFQLGIISNFDRRLHAILSHLGIASFFREVFISSELGADKPDLEIFRRALLRSGCRAEQALHVGDDPERDWKPALSVGMRVFQLDRSKNSLRDLLQYL